MTEKYTENGDILRGFLINHQISVKICYFITIYQKF